MQSIPQIVRERLRAAPASVSHPEADVLTAFAERALPEIERAGVLEHLSGCSECREVVALALPETDATIKVKVPARSGWLTWPAFRWGFAATGIVAIALFGIVEYQRSTRHASVVAESRNQTLANHDQGGPQPAPAATPNNIPEKTVQPPAVAPTEKARQTETRLTAHGGPANHSAQIAPSIGQEKGGGPKMPTQWQQRQQQTAGAQAGALMRAIPPAAATASNVTKPQSLDTSANLRRPATQAVEVQSSAEAVTATQAQTQPGPVPSPPSEQFFDYESGVGKAKPASNALHGAAAEFGGPVPRWNISSGGTLQRSFDQGATWQDVDVNASAAVAPNSAVLARASRAKEAKEQAADKTAPAVPIPPPVFRVVTVNGADIWAGGTNGVLYHSLDVGNHWIRVLPTSPGAVLTGDIVGMKFSDSQHGTITTSAGETWTTNDGGLTWMKS